MRTVGVVGLGNMGGGMARSLLRAGFDVVGFDVRAEAGAALAAEGGAAAESPAALAAGVDLALVMVLNYPQVEAAIFGDGRAGGDGAAGH